MMTTKGSDLSTRMSAEDQERYRIVKETAGKLFKRCKVEISNAIRKPYPFFEILQDHELITKEKYEECKQKLVKRITIEEVVYDILTELEETFDLRLLDALFNKIVMKNYPDLYYTFKTFKSGVPNISNFLESDAEENKGRSDIQLSFEQGTDRNSYPNLSWSSIHPLNYTEQLLETEEINVIVDTTTDNNDALESQQANEQGARQSEPAGADLPNHGIPECSGSIDSSNIKKEKPFFNSGVEWEAQGRTDCNQASDIIDISSEDSVGCRNREEAPEPSTSTVKRKSGIDNSENNSTSEKTKRKRRRRQQPAVPVDFKAEILPVTCKEKMGLLIKRKLERGATRKCIRTEDGNWFTPREFEVRGGYEKANDWRANLFCGGKSLRFLIQQGDIRPPPTTKKVENSGKCVICQDGGKLIGCVTCPRVFHEGCHLPPVKTKRNAWKCTYCTIGNAPRQQHYKESEVLMKVMGSEEESKCAFLLLNVYGPLESKVFPNIPHENYVEEASRCLEKLRELDKIKESLIKGDYPSVEHFVRAMDKFFTIPRCNDAEFTKDDFKKTFKKQFAIQETN